MGYGPGRGDAIRPRGAGFTRRPKHKKEKTSVAVLHVLSNMEHVTYFSQTNKTSQRDKDRAPGGFPP